MTVKELFTYMGIELNKVDAPVLLIEDYNYIINKAIQQWYNLNYNQYDLNQQKSDDLRVLKSQCRLSDKIKTGRWYDDGDGMNHTTISGAAERGASYRFKLPANYFHILNCIVQFKSKYDYKCYAANQYMEFPAARMTSELEAGIMNNIFMQPRYRRPFYYVSNGLYGDINYLAIAKYLDFWIEDFCTTTPYEIEVNDKPTNGMKYPGKPVTNAFDEPLKLEGETLTSIYMGADPTARKAIRKNYYTRISDYKTSSDNEISKYKKIWSAILDGAIDETDPFETKSKLGALYGDNYIEIRYGKDDSIWEIANLYIDYLRTPQRVMLTQEQFDMDIDTSQVMEFPDYVCYEIINTAVKLVMGNFGDPRLEYTQALNQTIAPPQEIAAAAQQQQQRRR